jgi:uroporphyrinogen decarboxylase
VRTNLPRPRPDFGYLRQALLRQGEPARLPFIELLADHEMMEAFLGETVPIPVQGSPTWTREDRVRYMDFTIRFHYEAGYDYVGVLMPAQYQAAAIASDDTAPERKHEQRWWANEHAGPINSWEDFERFPWPRPEDIDYFHLEWAGQHLPEGMQLVFTGYGGQFEGMVNLMGLAPLATALVDDPALVAAVAQRIGALQEAIFRNVVDMPNVGACWMSDDLGYKVSTTVSPRHLRQYVFPYHKRIGEIVHAAGMPYLLHSCGQLAGIMDDLIDEVGFDAKHSFEDVITPVTEAKRRWGHRVALLGGIDMDYLCRHSEQEVRAYTRRVIDACAPGGGYALGTGNTVANYIPLQNYVAMLEEGARGR